METPKKEKIHDKVTVLGLVCEKMTERVVIPRQEEEDRWTRQEVSKITQNDTFDEEDMEDDETREKSGRLHT